MAKSLALVFGMVIVIASSYSVTGDACNGGCRYYQVCDADVPKCVCPQLCPPVEDGALCSTRNRTYENECELYKDVCNLLKKNARARVPHADYPGPCQLVHPCSMDKFNEFPVRFTDWLEILQNHEETGEWKRPDANECELWTFANDTLHLKFFALDYDKNGFLETHEVHELRRQLLEVEPCTRRFFHSCAGKDKKITLGEWTICLKLPPQPDCTPRVPPTGDVGDLIPVNTTQLPQIPPITIPEILEGIEDEE